MYVLIPAYEPAEHLPELVAALAAADAGLSVLIVDDGSGAAFDDVFACAKAAGASLLRHDRNEGKGAALKTGFAYLQREHPCAGVVTADADGQHSPDDIVAVAARIVQLGERDGGTMVLGCRDFAGEVPLRSRFGNDVSRRLFGVAAGWSLGDTQTGLRGMSAAMLPWLLEVPGDRFEYEQRVLLGLKRAGFAAEERPIETVYLEGNASSHFRPVIDSIRVMLPTLAFAAGSFLGFLVDTVALFVIYAATGSLVPSIVAARVISATVNFTVNRRWVFLHRGTDGLVRQALGYALLAAVLLASNVVWLSYLTGIGVPIWIAKLVTELLLFFTSYRTQRTQVFAYRDRSSRATATVDSSGGFTPISAKF